MNYARRYLAVAGFAAYVTHAVAATPPPQNLLVLVNVTGAVQRSGGYQHEVDNQHRCVPALEVPPLPIPGSRFANTPFTVDFDSAARPPANGFRLELPFVSQGPGVQRVPNFRVAMTAGGRYWEGSETTGTGTFATDDAGITGNFTITGLHSAGSADTISVAGTWSCPHFP